MRLFLLLFTLLFTFSNEKLIAQGKLARELEIRKTISNIVDKSVIENFPEDKNLSALGMNKDGDAAFFIPDKKVISEIISEQPDLLRFSLPYGKEGKTFTLLLFNKKPFTKSAIVRTSEGERHQMNEAAYYRGIVEGEPNSLVAVSFFEGELGGVISSENNGQYDLGKTDKSDIHVVYNADALPYKFSFKCGTNDEESELINNIEEHLETRDAGDCVKIFFEASFSIFQNKGSVDNVQNFVNGFFNIVATLYDNEDVVVEISEIFVWTMPDPFPTNDSGDALDFYSDYRTTFNGDLAQLLARTNNGNGGVAWLNALCNDNIKYSYSDINMTYANFPNYSWTVMVVTHELGHNIGSNHTQWCGWPGGALDNCYETEGNCGPGPAPVNGGTIMSYCHLTGNGINLANGFGQLPGNKIRERILVKQCLAPCGPQCPTFVLTANTQNVTCSGLNNGFINLNTPTVGQQPFSYAWSNGATSQNITNLGPGNYTVEITDANNCTGTETFTINSPSALSVNGQQVNVTCFGESDGSISLNVNGGSPSYSYNWSNGNSGIINPNLSEGTYIVTITDANFCSLTQSFFITQPAVLAINESIGNITCHSSNNGLISASTTGGTGGVFYSWSTGATGQIITNLGPGSYSITVTDGNLCSTTETYELIEPTAMNAQVNTTQASSPLVADATATVVINGGTPQYTFFWSNGATGQSITNLGVGTYSVSITDANDCQVIQFFSIEAMGCQLNVEPQIVNNLCHGGNIGQATAIVSNSNGNVQYNWSNGATSQSVTGLTAGNYTVTVTDNACVVIENISISEPATLAVSATISSPTCTNTNGSITLNVNGNGANYTYLWSNGAVTQNISNLSAGTYTVTITDQNQCQTVFTQVITAVDNVAPVVINTNISVYLDQNGETDLTNIPDGYFYTDNCNLASVSFQSNIYNCDDLGTNTTMMSGVDGAGNSTNTVITVQVIDTLDPVIICPDNLTQGICQGAPIWDDISFSDNCTVSEFVQTSGFALGSIFPLGETLNSYIVTDNSGNSAVCSFLVTVTEGLAINLDLHNMSCNNVANGTAEVDITGLVDPFTIKWSTGETSNKIINLGEGTYTVSVSDGNGCNSVQEFTISNPLPIKMEVIEVKNASSSGAADGVILIEVSGGTNQFSYEWSLGGNVISTDQNPEGLAAGIYKVVIKDSNGCILIGAEITVGITLGNNNWKKDPITLYPNPADQMIYVTTKDIKNCTIAVYDILGRKVELISHLDKDRSLINTANLVNGTYILRVDQNDQWYVTKFVVSH